MFDPGCRQSLFALQGLNIGACVKLEINLPQSINVRFLIFLRFSYTTIISEFWQQVRYQNIVCNYVYYQYPEGVAYVIEMISRWWVYMIW